MWAKYPGRVLTTFNKENMASKLREIIENARIAYENGDPIMSDDRYDELLEEYEEMTGREYQVIGTAGDTKLPFYMPSLNKIKRRGGKDTRIEDLQRWTAKYKGPYIITDKMDGISALYFQGKLYTRGNGILGKDISHVVPHLKIPEISDKIAVRGEIVLSENNFNRYVESVGESKNKLKDPRSTVTGFLDDKDVPADYLNLLDFYAFSVVNLRRNFKTQLALLKKLGFKLPKVYVYDTISVDSLSSLLKRRRESDRSDRYMMDGIVIVQEGIFERVKGQNPKHITAYKEDVYAETVVTHVEWTIKKDGQLFPVVHFEPRHLIRTDVSKASGKNALFIEKNGIGPGAEIIICKAGDIIPDIVNVLKGVDPQFPDTPYEWDENHVRIQVIEYGKEQAVSQMAFFCKTIGVKGVGEKLISKIYDVGIHTISDLINATSKDIQKAFKSGSKTGENVQTWIQESLYSCSLPQLVAASGIFGRGVGVKRFEMILDMYPTFLESDDPSELLNNVNGIGPNMREKILANLDRFMEWINSDPLLSDVYQLKFPDLESETESSPDIVKDLEGEVILFSGFRDVELSDEIVKRGGKIVTGWSKKVTILLTNNKNSTTGKMKKAMQAGIKILTANEFRE